MRSLCYCLLFFVVVCVTAGRGATEVYWVLRPDALWCEALCIANLLRVACFVFSVCLEPFY